MLIIAPRKSVDSSILCLETQDSPVSVSDGETLDQNRTLRRRYRPGRDWYQAKDSASLAGTICGYQTRYQSRNVKSSCSSRHKSAKPSCQRYWRREWDLNPRAPKGHRLTVEPIPDMGQRARRTARYQAPESRLNSQTLSTTIFTFGKRENPNGRIQRLKSDKGNCARTRHDTTIS